MTKFVEKNCLVDEKIKFPKGTCPIGVGKTGYLLKVQYNCKIISINFYQLKNSYFHHLPLFVSKLENKKLHYNSRGF